METLVAYGPQRFSPSPHNLPDVTDQHSWLLMWFNVGWIPKGFETMGRPFEDFQIRSDLPIAMTYRRLGWCVAWFSDGPLFAEEWEKAEERGLQCAAYEAVEGRWRRLD